MANISLVTDENINEKYINKLIGNYTGKTYYNLGSVYVKIERDDRLNYYDIFNAKLSTDDLDNKVSKYIKFTIWETKLGIPISKEYSFILSINDLKLHINNDKATDTKNYLQVTHILPTGNGKWMNMHYLNIEIKNDKLYSFDIIFSQEKNTLGLFERRIHMQAYNMERILD